MRIHVKFFAILRERAGTNETTLDMPAGSTAAAAVKEIEARYELLPPHLARAAVAVNMEYAPMDRVLSDGDELALIPPVSGGTDRDWLEIHSDPIDPAAAIRFASNPDAGGIDIFLGTTRTQTGEGDRTLMALDYEAYTFMALSQFEKMAEEARRKWPVIKIVILHRTGRVAVGEPSVVVAVSTPHRAEAFEACRWLIDSIKAEVTIWKKEVWSDGNEKWLPELPSSARPRPLVRQFDVKDALRPALEAGSCLKLAGRFAPQ